MSAPSPKLGLNGTSQPERRSEPPPKFTWLQPHPIFVIVLVGPEERPFGIHKDLLSDRSIYYRRHFEQNDQPDTIEYIARLPDVSVDVFGLAQQFIYSGRLLPEGATVPDYRALIDVWKLGHRLEIDGLGDSALEAMAECRKTTGEIPSTPLLVQVWNETPEGSSIRKLLLSWTAEYMRSSDKKEGFAKSLPHTVLSELVIVMSTFDNVPVVQVPPSAANTPIQPTPARKSVHYLEDDSEEEGERSAKRNRRVSSNSISQTLQSDRKAVPAAARKPVSRPPSAKPVQKRRSSGVQINEADFSTEKKLEFCADLMTRMLSGPGFWTRLVGPFRQAVDPVEDGVPDYFEKVKRPMDLETIKAKMDRKEYADEEEFLVDIRQIFENCYAYWTKSDPMWAACEKFQKTFEKKYAGMNKFLSKLVSEPAD